MDNMLLNEVAATLRLSERRVRALVSLGRLRARRLTPKGKLLFSREDVEAALEFVNKTEPARPA
jgi:excisionase family DNA binding protein